MNILYHHCSSLYSAPTDYVAQSGTLTISYINSSDCIYIPIIADVVEEQDMECFILSFTSTSPGLILAPGIATICINEGKSIHNYYNTVSGSAHSALLCYKILQQDRAHYNDMFHCSLSCSKT